MKKYTFHELVDIAMERGANCADLAIGRMMDEIEEETGHWPGWNEEAPEWVVRLTIGG